MNYLHELLGKVKGWYGYIPPITSNAFMKFLGDAGHLITYVANTDKTIKFRFASTMTAAADLEKGEVIMPLWVLDANQYQNFYPHMAELPTDTDNALMTAVFTGFAIHEAAHHRWTKFSKRSIVKECFERDPEIKQPINERLATSCIDMMEDLFIEQMVREQRYGLFVDTTDEFLFSPEALHTFLDRFNESGDMQPLLGAIFCYKNPHVRGDDAWAPFQELTDVMDLALTERSQINRGKLAARLYKMMQQEVDENEGKQNLAGGTSPNDYDGGESDNDGPQQDGDYNKSYKVRSKANGNRDVQEMAEKIAHEINELLNQEDEFNIPPVEIVDVLKNRYRRGYVSANDIQAANTFKNLGRILALLKADNVTPGIPRKTGQRIVNTRLTRIVIDGKIFGEPRRKIDKNDREVILLIDYSGSMCNRIERTIQAARGAFDSLRASGTPCSVYGHSCVGNQPLVYHVVSFRMGTTSSQIERRWSETTRIAMEENYDGVAIEHCAKQFSRRNTPKILIVFSDGLPTGPGYRGNESEEHTKRAVIQARRKGILVFAVSLVPEIIENNNKFYGRQFNIDASRGNVDEKLREMLLSWEQK